MVEGQGIGRWLAPWRLVVWAAALLAITGALRAGFGMDWARSVMIGFDAATALFVLLCLPLLRGHNAAAMRRHARDNDANRLAILLIAPLVSVVIMVAVWSELGARGSPPVGLIIGTLLAAWVFANMVWALHYAHIYYADGSAGGLEFAGDEDPDYADFIYFAFTLGMTFQTSDTAVATRQLRRIVTMHSFAAFVFNLGIVAFTINVLGSQGGQ